MGRILTDSHESKALVADRGTLIGEGALQTSYRFILSVRGVDAAFITNVSRPSYTVATEDAKILNWSFSYPTSITWEPINFSIKEIFAGYTQQTILGLFYKKLTDYGWNTPDFKNPFGFVDNDLSKNSLKVSLGENMTIKSIDDEGNAVETWTLHGAFITSVDRKSTRLNSSH